jgi:hypothetical protein
MADKIPIFFFAGKYYLDKSCKIYFEGFDQDPPEGGAKEVVELEAWESLVFNDITD